MGGMDAHVAPPDFAEAPIHPPHSQDQGSPHEEFQEMYDSDTGRDPSAHGSEDDDNGHIDNDHDGHDDNDHNSNNHDQGGNVEDDETDEEDNQAEHDPTAHFVWVNRMDAVEETDKCPACQSIVASHEIVYLACGHPWCNDCLNNNIRTALTNRDHWPPRCCNYTRDGIDLSVIQAHLDDDVLLRFLEVGEEFSSKNPVFCFDPKCSAFIPASQAAPDEHGQWATCLHCQKVTCTKCKGDKNLHPTPDQHPDIMTKENRDLSNEQGWKECPNPNCHRVIERSDGCDHMRCGCGTHFCYRCGRVLAGTGDVAGLACNCGGQNPWVDQLRGENDPDAPPNAENFGVHDADRDNEGDGDHEDDHGSEGDEDAGNPVVDWDRMW